ncbi:MAG TPA: hypothetical protein PKY31_02285 [Spirochaetota bacterium]|nr:hypothetical protein [Spirochaetota bacterium]
MHVNTCFRALLLSALLAVLNGGLPAVATPIPLSENRLMAASGVVVEGPIVAVTFLGHETRADWSVWSYRAELRARRVLKGAVSAGTVVHINWSREKWMGAGPEPDGRARGPEYYPCEEARVYLAKDRDGYHTCDHWNGKKLIRKASTFPLPDRARATVRCKGR